MIIVLLFLMTRFSEEHDHMCSKFSGQEFWSWSLSFSVSNHDKFFIQGPAFPMFKVRKSRIPDKRSAAEICQHFHGVFVGKNRCRGCICEMQKRDIGK